MGRQLDQGHRQDHRGVEQPCDQPRAATENPPCDGRRGQRAEHAEQQARQSHGRFRHAEDLQRGGDRPEIEDRLVEERFVQLARHDPIAALDHLLRNRGVQPFVRIDQGYRGATSSGQITPSPANRAKTSRLAFQLSFVMRPPPSRESKTSTRGKRGRPSLRGDWRGEST